VLITQIFAFTGGKIAMLASCKNAKTKPQFKQKYAREKGNFISRYYNDFISDSHKESQNKYAFFIMYIITQ